MQFQQIPPPDHLKAYIRTFWALESNAADDTSKSFRTMADGCPGLLFQQPEKGVIYQNDKQLPNIILYGQATTHAALSLKGQFSTIGIFFQPNALNAIFGLNAEALTDTCLNLDELAGEHGFSLLEQVSNAAGIYGQVEVICSYITALLRRQHRDADNAMQFALSSIIQSKGSVSLITLRETLQLSERSFERKFKQHVGIPPKLYSRIARFQASLEQLKRNQFDKLSDIAFENDYADQSHFIRSFKEFAGCSPFQYQKLGPEVIDNLMELFL
jgi:AraC-like DNA-binding protein